MDFKHLARWQDKAKSMEIETRLFINGEYCSAVDNTTFETIDPAAQHTLAHVARGKRPTSTSPFRPHAASLNAATGHRRHPQSVKRCSISWRT